MYSTGTIVGGGAMFGSLVGAMVAVNKNYAAKKIAAAIFFCTIIGAVVGYGITSTIELIEVNKKES